MTDQPTTYKHGDIANGHVLCEDNVWRPLAWIPAPVPSPGPRPAAYKPSKLVIGAAACVLSVLVVGGAVLVSTAPDDPHEAFAGVMLEQDGQQKRLVSEMDLFNDALPSDPAGGALHARIAASLFAEIADNVRGNPEAAASPFGVDMVEIYDQCETAWIHSADALTDHDGPGVTAAAGEIETCSTDVGDLAERIAAAA